MRCQPTAPQSPCSSPASVLAVHGLQESPEDRRGGLRGIKGVSRYPKSLPWSLHRHVSDNLRCSKQSRFFRRVLSILPPSPLSATAHLQPLAQPTALRHPGSRCDIDSHPDCRPFLILIVAPHRGLSELPRLRSAAPGSQLGRHAQQRGAPVHGDGAASGSVARPVPDDHRLQSKHVRRCGAGPAGPEVAWRNPAQGWWRPPRCLTNRTRNRGTLKLPSLSFLLITLI